MSTARRLSILGLLSLAAALLSGCGFHPLYGPGAANVDAKLPDIFVATIPGRPGQQLRQALQQRLAGSSDADPQGYTLRVGYGLDNEAIAIHGDNTSARSRVVGRATWTLSTVAQAPVVLATGNARTLDGYNNIEAQFFASTLASEATYERIAENLANSITIQISTWFAAHPRGLPAGAEPVPASAPEPARTASPGFLGPQNVPGDSDQSPLQQIGPDGLPSGAIGRTTR